jgi:ferritin-like metal-binding protein YciE
MPDEDLAEAHQSFPDLYVDVLWNLRAGARVLMATLPVMVERTTDREIATVLRDLWGQASHTDEQLNTVLSRFDGPARMHAAEMETLIGVAMRRFGSWPRGDPHDVAACAIVRAAIHTAIPGCELAIVLAKAIGFAQHVGGLEALRGQMQVTDDNLRRLSEQRITEAYAAPPR